MAIVISFRFYIIIFDIGFPEDTEKKSAFLYFLEYTVTLFSAYFEDMSLIYILLYPKGRDELSFSVRWSNGRY
jgi:hypothetical protein